MKDQMPYNLQINNDVIGYIVQHFLNFIPFVQVHNVRVTRPFLNQVHIGQHAPCFLKLILIISGVIWYDIDSTAFCMQLYLVSLVGMALALMRVIETNTIGVCK